MDKQKLQKVFLEYKKQSEFLTEAFSKHITQQFVFNKNDVQMLHDLHLSLTISRLFRLNGIVITKEDLTEIKGLFNQKNRIEFLFGNLADLLWTTDIDLEFFEFEEKLSILHLLKSIVDFKSPDQKNPFRPSHSLLSFYKHVLESIEVSPEKIDEIISIEYEVVNLFLENINEQAEILVKLFELIAEIENEKIDKLQYEDLFIELNKLVGLEEVKTEVKSYINLLKVNLSRENFGLATNKQNYHMIFLGNPGTGKTTVARILARILHELNVISKGHLVEVDRSMLVAGYIGQTAIQTKAKIDEAKGGVLFIDEAYALARGDNDRDFGIESIDTLGKYMEDYREDLVVIMAGYSDEMEDFLESNPGLKSRINKFINFPDYSLEEQIEIFKILCSDNEYVYDPDVLTRLQNDLERLGHDQRVFGNARGVRNYFESLVKRQSNRIVEQHLLHDKKQINKITLEDFEQTRSSKKPKKLC